MSERFFPPNTGILPSVAAARGLSRAADGLLLQLMQETHKPSEDMLSRMEINVRQAVLEAANEIRAMVPQTREEAYTRTDFLMERALVEGGPHSEMREILAEGERYAASLPDDVEIA